MIRNIKHQLKLQELITKYAEKCNAEWITLDETLEYKKNSIFYSYW